MSVVIKYADMGTVVRVLSYDDNSVSETLKTGVYSVGFDPNSGFFLNKKDGGLNTPTRVYGSVSRKVEKILRSYEESKSSLGILLSGDKGSGKTMTSSLVANECIKRYDIPVILVEDSFGGSSFVNFISSLGECVLFIDEFGKKFDDGDGDQEALLGLFDGTSASKRLVILTENRERDINRYMINRPGRIKYHFRHDKVEVETIREYCGDEGLSSDVTEQIVLRQETSIEFSFDVLQAIVREYKLFGGSIEEICVDLNIEQPISRQFVDIDIISVYDVTNDTKRKLSEGRRNNQVPFPSGGNRIPVDLLQVNDPDSEYADTAYIGVRDIVGKEGDIYVFKAQDDENNELIIKARQVERDMSYMAY